MSTAKRNRISLLAVLDEFFFVFAGLAAIWLAWLLLTESFQLGWWGITTAILFWALLAYLVLPRIHRVLTTIYVPDYFIGRTRTSDGLLGDPVNLALLGSQESVHEAMTTAGWTQADSVTFRSSWRIITSTLTRRSYDEAPVSPLYLFGRMQDFAYQQEVAGNPAKRHHVRFWRTPEDWLLPGGERVDWLAAGTFDRAVGFSLFTMQITHKIDADTDIERDHIVNSVLDGNTSVTLRVLQDFSTGYHSRNGGGDSIRTDGNLPILDLRPLQWNPAEARHARELPHSDPLKTNVAKAQTVVNTRTPQKRGSMEPAEALLAREEGLPVDAKRPLTTSLGAIFVLFRAVAGFLWMGAFALLWHDMAIEAELDPVDDQFVLWLIVGIGGLLALALLLLAIAVWRGSNLARVVVMLGLVFSIITAAIGYFVNGEEITVHTTLLTVALDILVLLALSSRSSRAWARQKAKQRHSR